MTQYSHKKNAYLQSFLKNRVLSIYLLTAFLILLYGTYRLLLGYDAHLLLVIQSFLIGDSVVSNGWYLQVIVLFYLIWYFCFRFFSNPRLRSGLLCGGVILYMLAAAWLFSGRTWYVSSFSFLLGIVFSVHMNSFKRLFFATKTRYVFWLFLTFFLFAGCYIAFHINWANDIMLNNFIRSFFACLSSPLFCIFVILTLVILPLERSKVLYYLGGISIEIYVLQGIPLDFLHSDILYCTNGWLYIFGVTAMTILLSVALHPFIRFITNIPQKYIGIVRNK